MSMLDGILGQLGGSAPDVANLAEKVGLPKGQVEKAIGMLAKKHQEPGDTVTEASSATGIDAGKLSEIVGHIGGEGSLTQFNELIQGDGDLMSKLTGFFDKDGDGSAMDELGDMAKGLFGKK